MTATNDNHTPVPVPVTHDVFHDHAEAELQKQGPATSLKDFNAVDVALALAVGTPPEKIASTIKRLGGNPAEYGI